SRDLGSSSERFRPARARPRTGLHAKSDRRSARAACGGAAGDPPPRPPRSSRGRRRRAVPKFQSSTHRTRRTAAAAFSKQKSQKWPDAARRPDPGAWLSEPPLTFAGERQLSTGAPALRSWYKGPDRRTQFRRLAISSRDAEAGTRADSWRADAHQVRVHCSPNLLRYGL